MMSALFAGVSGLRNHMVRMNLVGNNIANINTVGFKSGRVTFREALVQTIRGAGRPVGSQGGTNPVQMGLGMSVSSVDNIFAQGGLETTGVLTDLAIQGAGFFILSDGYGEYYTRSGAFGLDANSNLVNTANGMYVQGKMANNDGTVPATAALGNIDLPFGQQDPARGTTSIQLANNLNATATTATATLVSSGETNIDAVTGMSIDGAGGTHTLTITGTQPTNSIFTGTNATGGALAMNDLLGADLGITQVGLDDGNFRISVDGDVATPVTGLTLNSTVADLIAAMNAIQGVDAELVGGEIQLTRTFAGDGTTYHIEVMCDAVAGNTNVVRRVFNTAADTVSANNGTAHTFVVSDVFQPTGETSLPAINLSVSVNETTGLVTGITDLGDGGVTIISSSQLAAGTAVIETADTQHATSITIYDSQGGKHTAVFTFTKRLVPNTWKWEVSTAANEILRSGYKGEVTFTDNGALASFTFGDLSNSMVIDPNNGAAVMNVKLFPGTGGEHDGLTGFSAPFTAITKNQDGYGMGMLDKISIDESGTITGIFTNGISRTLAQILLADFNNQGGLLKVGETLFSASANSGDAIKGVAGATINASLSSGALESSNVDLAQEFTDVIIAQRGFQANARVISTSDQLLNELVNLKS
jgi:flagellar hook protein FlgE